MNELEFAEMMVTTGLGEKSQAALEAGLAKTPNDRQLLAALGAACRKNGQLSRATEVYQSLAAVSPPNSGAAFLYALLRGEKLPGQSQTDQLWPASFVRIPSYLSWAEREQLDGFVTEHEGKFRPLSIRFKHDVGAQQIDASFRFQVGVPFAGAQADAFQTRILTLLPDFFDRMRMEPFEVGDLRMTLALTGDGHFGRAHTDLTLGKVSFAYYFHSHPKKFLGGDLLLYDTDLRAQTFDQSGFTRIAPEDNTLVMFPSYWFHAITKVRCSGDSFRDGRFAVTGHIQSASGDP